MGVAHKNLTVKSDVSWMPQSKSGFDLECWAFCSDLKKKRFKVDRIPLIDRMFEKNAPTEYITHTHVYTANATLKTVVT